MKHSIGALAFLDEIHHGMKGFSLFGIFIHICNVVVLLVNKRSCACDLTTGAIDEKAQREIRARKSFVEKRERERVKKLANADEK